MKMKFADRLLMRLGGLVSLLIGGGTLLSGVVLSRWDLGTKTYVKLMPYALIAGGAFVILYALYAIAMPHRYSPRRRAFIVQTTELGELRIAVKAVENLILKCIEKHKEVKVQEMAITNRRGAVYIELRVAINSNISIPHAVEQLQTQIKRYIMASSGIDVRNISVSVDRAVDDGTVLNKENLVVPAEVNEARAEEKPAEKIPLHQRIFGRDPSQSEAEQMIAAEMVMPPEAEASQEEDAPIEVQTAEEVVSAPENEGQAEVEPNGEKAEEE